MSREEAVQVLQRFAERTLASATRYLWTDAFAVMGLAKLGQDRLAQQVAHQVHAKLGLPSATSPIGHGLRIGKKFPERRADEPFDERKEWDRDGVYYHYVTKWASALKALGREEEAREMLRYTTGRFIHNTARGPRMYWKMSTDLSRPLVASSGLHDPLDGLLTLRELGVAESDPLLALLQSMAGSGRAMATSDSLGIGGLLMDCARATGALRSALIESATQSVALFGRNNDLEEPAELRLAFRELGLSIGAAVAKRAGITVPGAGDLAAKICSFWNDSSHRNNETYRDHYDINEVMRACAMIF